MRPKKSVRRVESIKEIAQRFPGSFDSASFEVFTQIVTLFEKISHAQQEYFDSHDMSAGRFNVMSYLCTNESAAKSPSDIADHCGITRATVTGLLDNLERAKLIVRKDSPGDRRGLVIQATPKGVSAFLKLVPDYFSKTAAVTRGLTNSEKATFFAILKKLNSGADDFLEVVRGGARSRPAVI